MISCIRFERGDDVLVHSGTLVSCAFYPCPNLGVPMRAVGDLGGDGWG